MAARVVLNRTKTELLVVNTQKRHDQLTSLQYDGRGAGISLEDIEERRRVVENIKKRTREGPGLIYGRNPSPSNYSSTRNTTAGDFSTRHEKCNDPIFTYAFQALFRISPDTFEEFILDDLV